MSSTTETRSPQRHTAGLFDVRNIIAMLMSIYGVVLIVMGLVNFTEEDKRKADDVNLNLWAGIGILIFAILMGLWAYLRPIVVDEVELERDKAAADMAKPNLPKED